MYTVHCMQRADMFVTSVDMFDWSAMDSPLGLLFYFKPTVLNKQLNQAKPQDIFTTQFYWSNVISNGGVLVIFPCMCPLYWLLWNTCIFYLRACLPVVHEDIWLPEDAGRHPNVLHVAIFRGVPPQIGISPLLQVDMVEKRQHTFHLLQTKIYQV